jgi:uncharacterized membrane protein
VDLGGLCAFVGAVLVVSGVPMWRAWLRPNAWWGIRMPIAYRSRAHWDRLNRAGGAIIAGWGVGLLVAGTVASLGGVEVQRGDPLAMALPLGTIGMVVHLIRRVVAVTGEMQAEDHAGLVTLDPDPRGSTTAGHRPGTHGSP